MPTYETDSEFDHDYVRLTSEQRMQFNAAVKQMVTDLKAKRNFHPSLRVQRFHKRANAYEMR